MSVNTATSGNSEALDLFTPEFKRLKSRNPSPDLTDVVDLTKLDLTPACSDDKAIRLYPIRNQGLRPVAGLKPCAEWKAFQFTEYPGLIVILNPFVDGYQRYWVYRCLQSFPSDNQNVTNLTALGDNSSGDLWSQFVEKKSDSFAKNDPLRKLRWTTLGYHYNWTTKEYSEDNKAPFPSDVNCLSQYLASCLGFDPYQAEAAIVNYYHLDSTLAGHIDHSELDHSAPLFSISFGQTAIFLIGGHTKSEKPMAVFLRSGDVCVMSGDCRLSYHAVPKILAPPTEDPIPNCFTLATVRHKQEVGSTGACGTSSEFSLDSIEKGIPKPRHTAVNSNCDINDKDNFMTVSHICEDPYCHMATKNIDKEETTVAVIKNTNVPDKQCFYFKNYDLNIGRTNSNIEEVVSTLEFNPFEVYLKTSRINLNVRQVLPPGWTKLENKRQRSSSGSDFSQEGLCGKMIKRDIDCIGLTS